MRWGSLGFILILPVTLPSQPTRALVGLLAARTATSPQMLWDGSFRKDPGQEAGGALPPGRSFPEPGKDPGVSPASVPERQLVEEGTYRAHLPSPGPPLLNTAASPHFEKNVFWPLLLLQVPFLQRQKVLMSRDSGRSLSS